MRRYAMVAVVVGSMVVGGVVGTLVFGAVSATAQSTRSNNPTVAAWGGGPRAGHWGPFGAGFGSRESVSDLSVAAKAIGISESDLMTALRSGSSIADVANQHAVAVQTVIDALVKDAEAELAAAVKAGRITQAQADQAKAGIEARVTARVNAPGGMFPHGPFGPDGPGRLGGFGFGFGPGAGAGLSVAAKTIGVSEAALVKALRGGSSIAQVAKLHGVTPEKVVAALAADAKSRLDAAVNAGRVTQQQANAIESNLTQRITDMVNHAGLGCDGGMGGPGLGHGPPGDGHGARRRISFGSRPGGRRAGSADVAFDRLLVPDLRLVGVEPRAAQCPPLMEQVPALVERHLQPLEPFALLLARLAEGFTLEQRVLLVGELVDLFDDLGIVHGAHSAARTRNERVRERKARPERTSDRRIRQADAWSVGGTPYAAPGGPPAIPGLPIGPSHPSPA